METNHQMRSVLIAPKAKRVTATVEFLFSDDGELQIALVRFDEPLDQNLALKIRDYLDPHTR